MMKATRRKFLKQVGVMGTGLMLRPSAPLLAEPRLSETVGRAFALTPVRNHPQTTAPITSQLIPHAQTPIIAISEDGHWYQVPDGYVERSALQPIAPYQRPVIEETTGFYAEMIAPVSSIRQWCAANAPILATLGYGAMLYVKDRLTDDRGAVWYGLATEAQQDMIGWSPALHYARWVPLVIDQRPTRLVLDTQSSRLMVLQGEDLLLALPAAIKGNGAKSTHVRAAGLIMQDDIIPMGAPYHLQLDNGGSMYGSYWHNHFVRETQETGSINRIADTVTVELPVYAARWLYSALGSDEMVMTIK